MTEILDAKAPSPKVIAIIVLVALVTYLVATLVVSTFSPFSIAPLEIKELTVTGLNFTVGDSLSGRIAVNVTNFCASDVTVGAIKIDGKNARIWSSKTSDTLVSSTSETFTITHSVVEGAEYYISMWETDGTLLTIYTDTA